MMTMKYSHFYSPLLIGLLIAIVVSGCKNNEDVSASDEPSVSGLNVKFDSKSASLKRIQTAAAIDAQAATLILPGRITWDEDHTSRIIPTVSGRFVEIPKAGQLGANVKPQEALAYLLSPDVGTAQTEAISAQAALVQAEKNYNRLNELVVEKGASLKDAEQAKSDYEHAKADAVRAQLRVDMLGVNSNSVDQRLTVRSPIAGVIVERNTNPALEWRADQGGAPLFTVTDPTYLWCQIDIPEQAIDSVHSGVKVIVHSNAWPQENFEAVIDNIGDSIDSSSRTIKARAHLRNVNRHLKNDMYVTAVVVSDIKAKVDIPAKAVFLNNNEQQVFVKTAEGVFTRKVIKPVASTDQWVSLTQGINKGDQVVVDGALYLEQIIEDATQQPASDKPKL